MDKVTLLRDFCQTMGLPFAHTVTAWAIIATPALCSSEESISPTVTTVVKEVRQVTDGDGPQYVAYLYDGEDERTLPIWISPSQAFSIASVLSDPPFRAHSRTT